MTNSADVILARVRPDASLAEWRTALTELSRAADWHSPGDAPFSNLVSSSDDVLVKPNWVLHRNKGPWGLEPLITSPKLVQALCELILANSPRSVTLGDAPLQGCDFEMLLEAGGYRTWANALRQQGAPLRGPLDFRRTIAREAHGILIQAEEQRQLDRYRFVDLETSSLLEPVTSKAPTFRVTQYDPDLMPQHHQRGRHRYLIAQEVLDATVVFNVPKLKTHKKAGMTAALKNLVGINGNKEFLPHHRVGSPAEGGDCYPRSNIFKRIQEALYDSQNRSSSRVVRQLFRAPIFAMGVFSRYHRERFGLEGAWRGNDTVWRMCLDLNRALLYADRAGVMQCERQRREYHIIDGAIAGQGDGPLAAEPFRLGVVLASECASAADHIGAALLGYDPSAIPLVRESFAPFAYPIARSPASAVRCVDTNGVALDRDEFPLPTRYPEGWLGCVDTSSRADTPQGTTFQTPRAT